MKCLSRLDEFVLIITAAPGKPRKRVETCSIIGDVCSNLLTSASTLRRIKIQLDYLDSHSIFDEFFEVGMDDERSRVQNFLLQLPNLKEVALAVTTCKEVHGEIIYRDFCDDSRAMDYCARLFPELHRRKLLVVEETESLNEK